MYNASTPTHLQHLQDLHLRAPPRNLEGLSRCRARTRRHTSSSTRKSRRCSSVSMCTFVPVKQVNCCARAAACARAPPATAAGCSSVSICTFVPVKASELSTCNTCGPPATAATCKLPAGRRRAQDRHPRRDSRRCQAPSAPAHARVCAAPSPRCCPDVGPLIELE